MKIPNCLWSALLTQTHLSWSILLCSSNGSTSYNKTNIILNDSRIIVTYQTASQRRNYLAVVSFLHRSTLCLAISTPTASAIHQDAFAIQDNDFNQTGILFPSHILMAYNLIVSSLMFSIRDYRVLNTQDRKNKALHPLLYFSQHVLEPLPSAIGGASWW